MIEDTLQPQAPIASGELAHAPMASSETLLRALTVAGVGVWEWYPATNVVNWSDEVIRILGFGSATGQDLFASLADHVHPADRETWLKSVQACLDEGRPHRLEMRVIRPDGVLRWIAVDGDAERNATGEVTRLIGVVTDVTEAVSARRETQQFFSIALHLLLIATTDGVIRRANPAWKERLGWDAEALVGTSFMDLVHPDDEERTREETSRLASGKATASFINRYRTSNGDYRWLAWAAVSDVSTGLIYAIAHDISKRRQAEQALEESQQLYQALTDASPVGVFRADAQGHLHYANPRWHDITGVQAAQLEGDGWLDALHQQDRARIADRWRDSCRSAVPFKAEFRFARPGREPTWVLGQAHPQRGSDGVLLGFVGTVTDISQQKTIELALRAGERRLQEAERVARIGYWHLNLLTEHLTWSDGVFALFEVEPYEFPATYAAFLERVHPDDRDEVDRAFKRSVKRHEPYDVTHRVRLNDGGVRWVRERAETRYASEGLALRSIGTVQDVTEVRRHEDQLAAIAQRSEALLALPEAADRLGETAFLQHGLSRIEALTKSQISFVHFINADQESIELVTWSRPTLEGYCSAAYDSHYPVSVAGVWADALRQRAPVVINDYPSCPDQHGLPEGHAPLQRLISLPVIEHGRVRMLLGVGNKRNDYTPEDVETVQLMANSMWHLVERARSLSRLRLVDRVLHDTAEGVIITKTDGEIVAVNPAFEAISGYREAEVLGKTPRILNSGHHDSAFFEHLWSTLLDTGTWRGELWNRRKDGTLYPEWLTISAVHDEHRAVTHYVGVFRDITAQKEAQTRIDYLAQYDALTALPNRLVFRERLAQALLEVREESAPLSVLLIDLDRFKVVNDTLGHARGDQILRLVANRLAEAKPAHATLARLGGDEFVMLLERSGDPLTTGSVALGLIARIAGPLVLDGRELVITASIGISQCPENGDDVDTLMRYAEQAMYDAKRAGRNGFRFFTPEMNERAIERMTMEHALRGAVARDELLLMFQPQVGLTDGALHGVEALVRWRHPDLGLVTPNRFIALAEEIGLIGDIGAWVLETACRQLAAWDTAGLTVPCVAVNLSVKQLEQGDIVETVAAALDGAGIAPPRLELEVTESMLMRDPEANRLALSHLKALGVHLAMDDFGTGYSNLAMLKLLSLDRLKIDQSFMRDIGYDSNDESIVTAIIALAGGLGLETIAEGVEEVHQAEFLRRAGVAIVQGYLYGRPMPAEAILATWSTAATRIQTGDVEAPGSPRH